MTVMEIAAIFLENVRFRFQAVKSLGDGALAQVGEADCYRTLDGESNSVGVIVQHMHGNMLSRWTDFLTADGEKTTRDRDGEFIPAGLSRAQLLERWEEGWAVTLAALDALAPADLARTIMIRGQSLGVIDAILRQFDHYSYHTGQMVQLAKHWREAQWRTLSIARGQSKVYRPAGRD